MSSHCKVCGEEDRLVPCYICMEWFCPKHRVCLGDVNGAVYCAEHLEYVSTPAREREKDLEVERFIRTSRQWLRFFRLLRFVGIACMSAIMTTLVIILVSAGLRHLLH